MYYPWLLTVPELSNQDRDRWPAKPKYLLFEPLHKKFATPELDRQLISAGEIFLQLSF